MSSADIGVINLQQLLLSSLDSKYITYAYKSLYTKHNIMNKKKQNKKFRYLRHTADIAFFAYGNTLEDCFKSSSIAMLSSMREVNKLDIKNNLKKQNIKEKATNIDNLLWYFLQKIISITYVKSILPISIEKIKISKKNKFFYLNAQIIYKNDQIENSFLMDVKAVTPHDLKVEYIGKIYRSHVILDI